MKKRAIIFISALMALVIGLFIYYRISKNSNDLIQPIAVEGYLDLTRFNFNDNRTARLDGDWEFYWNQFISPGEFQREEKPIQPNWIHVPTRWNKQPSGKKSYGSFGFATYRLILHIHSTEQIKAFKIPEINTAYKMWVNGRLLAESGITGKDKSTTVPRYLPLVRMFKPESNLVEVVIHVSNFHYAHGGIWKSIVFGNETDILNLRKNSLLIEMFLIGALLAMGLFHIGLYMLYRKEHAMLFFGLFCLIIMLRSCLTGERILLDYFRELPWIVAVRIEHLPVFFGPVIFLLFLKSLYPKEVSYRIFRLILYTEIVGSCIALFLSPIQYEYLFIIIQLILALVCIYCLVIMLSAFRKKLYGANFLLTGYVVLFLTVMNDILCSRFIINTTFVIPFGLAFYILFAFALQKKFVSAEKELRLQKDKLKHAEKMTTLGTFIACVTHDINNPNTSIKITSQELATLWKDLLPLLEEYKEEFGDFDVGGITFSDLKDNVYEDFSRITRNSDRIHHIVNGLKAFVNPGKEVIDKKISVNSAIRTSIKLFHNDTEKNIVFSVDLEKRIPCIKGKFWDIVQVIINLMQNACDAISSEEGTVHIKTFSDQMDKKVIVTLEDNGVGISKDQISKIYNEFYTTKRDTGGTGLGLFIASVIIKNHAGVFDITSTKGKGTRVRIIFNMAE
jgi:signal transduction histidine kinase